MIRSGDDSNTRDLIPLNSTFEIKPLNAAEFLARNLTFYQKTDDNFYVLKYFQDDVGSLDNLEEADVNVNITDVRISIRTKSERWILISKIYFS